MNIRLFLLWVIVLVSCSKEDETFIGTYESSYTLYEKVKANYIDNEGRSEGLSLTLNPDSSFYYESCGSILDGKWKVVDDSLRLYVLRNTRKKNDSTIYITNNFYYTYFINGHKLIYRGLSFHLNLNRDTIYGKNISILKKVE